VGTTEFNLPPETQNLLVESGRRAALRFLDEFEPAEYRNTFGATVSG
jgi:hypothetical protein